MVHAWCGGKKVDHMIMHQLLASSHGISIILYYNKAGLKTSLQHIWLGQHRCIMSLTKHCVSRQQLVKGNDFFYQQNLLCLNLLAEKLDNQSETTSLQFFVTTYHNFGRLQDVCRFCCLTGPANINILMVFLTLSHHCFFSIQHYYDHVVIICRSGQRVLDHFH